MEGRPIKIKINAGIIVQNNSRGWESKIILFKELLVISEYMLYITILVIRIKIVIAWSWNRINCSIRGLAES
jgi:hypothetical protein